MSPQIQVSESEVADVIAWAEQHRAGGTTDHEDGAYEDGVHDALMWALGYIQTRPDQ
ncbi:hypothetical protein [Neptunomonas antarctica]|uniref:Uncharacterized protein n=1 Tax=Neptunomonas antarctica TaxID=619304 RepID=A0A1N7MQV7_9GAMM|nr:hypothetical protein [Neptunomonas antarctica]SIS88249.1 hypothetical protein SAMN05421760_106262 [Neptunomonas antarctica]